MIKINNETCTRCGNCTDVCPPRILKSKDDGSIFVRPEKEAFCLHCGQCMAICNSRSVLVDTLSYENNIFPLPSHNMNFENMLNFMKNRRSTRNFKNKPVENDVLQKILEGVTYSPSGANSNSVEITIINNSEILNKSKPLFAGFYHKMRKWLENPFMRMMIKSHISKSKYNTVMKFILPKLKQNQYDIVNGEDTIFRNAPCVMLFHGHQLAKELEEDATIWMVNAYMLAHSLGLGTTVIGLIPSAINKEKELQKLFQIPENHIVVCSLILGYPKYRFKNGIQRTGLKYKIL